MKFLGTAASLHWFPNGAHMEKDARFQSLPLHILQGSQLRGFPTTEGEKLCSPSTEPHADGKPTYNWVRPGSRRQSFTTLLSLPQGHAAFNAVPSTLASVNQSPVSQRVSYNPLQSVHTCYCLRLDPRLRNCMSA